jgi:hypothetical protein
VRYAEDVSGPDQNLELIKRILGASYLELRLSRLSTEEVPELAARVVVEVSESGSAQTIEGEGVGPIDALWGALVGRYAREYQSLKSLALAGFTVSAAIESKRRKAGLDALARVELAVQNSEGKRFTFHDESRSVTVSAARAVIAIAEYFVNAERAFVTLFNARKDALTRGRHDLVARYTAELAEVVKSTSYAEVIESLRKELS